MSLATKLLTRRTFQTSVAALPRARPTPRYLQPRFSAPVLNNFRAMATANQDPLMAAIADDHQEVGSWLLVISRCLRHLTWFNRCTNIMINTSRTLESLTSKNVGPTNLFGRLLDTPLGKKLSFTLSWRSISGPKALSLPTRIARTTRYVLAVTS